MNVFYSELCLIGGGVEENVDRLIDNGAENIELMLDGAGWNGFHLRMEELALALNDRKVKYSVHAPVWDANLTCENAQLRKAVLETYRSSIIFASMLEAGHVVLHTGWCTDTHFSKETARLRARESLLSLCEFNEAYGQLLLVENIGSKATSLFTEREFMDFLSDFPEAIGYIVDIGHAHINEWRIDTLLPGLGDRLYALHIHDNDGNKDKHAPIGEGNIDWSMVMAASKGTKRELSLILEYNIGTELGRLAEGKVFLESAMVKATLS
jgi:sugar phosphate isomerase/epimerase